MKATVANVQVEGTPDEIAALIRALESSQAPVSPLGERESAPDRVYVSEKVAFLALKRRPLSIEQKRILKTLRDSHPDWTLATHLRDITGYNSNQLAGLFGAFGKRIASTDGYVAGSWFFEQVWDFDHDCYAYRLPGGVLHAVQRVPL